MSKASLPFSRAAKIKTAPGSSEEFIASSAMASRLDAPSPPPAIAQKLTDSEDESIYRTVNVKLNRRRYSQFKLLSAITEKPMQQYMVELIDELLERNAASLKQR